MLLLSKETTRHLVALQTYEGLVNNLGLTSVIGGITWVEMLEVLTNVSTEKQKKKKIKIHVDSSEVLKTMKSLI